ncbi:HERC2, partial [Symbiodinium necroappetens]
MPWQGLSVEDLSSCLLRESVGNVSSRHPRRLHGRLGFGRLPISLHHVHPVETVDRMMAGRRQYRLLPWRLAMQRRGPARDHRRALAAAKRWNLFETLSERAPVFDVFGAAANGSDHVGGRPSLSEDAPPVRGMQVLRGLRSEVSQLWGRLSASGWEEQLVALRNGFCLGNQSVLVRLRETLAELDAWKAKEPFWLEQGRAMGLWAEMERTHTLLMFGPSVRPGQATWTSHLPTLQHSLYTRSGNTLIGQFVASRGSWVDADVVAHVLLFVLQQTEPQSRPVDWPVLDVGANIGSVTILLLKLGFPVHAVEADKGNALAIRCAHQARVFQASMRACHRRIGSTSRCNVLEGPLRLSEVAASDSAGELLLSVPTSGKPGAGDGAFAQVRRSAADFINVDAAGGTSFEKVHATTIDQLLATEVVSPRIIKVDVEGFEMQVLRGAKRALRTAEYLFTEVWPAALETHCTPWEFMQQLSDFPYAYEVRTEALHVFLLPLDLSKLLQGDSWSAAPLYNTTFDALFSKNRLRVQTAQSSLHLRRNLWVSVQSRSSDRSPAKDF